MSSTKIDIVDGANFTWTAEQNGRVMASAERVASVTGLTAGTPGEGATALRRAVDAVKAVVPPNTGYDADNPQCVARSYAALGANPFTDRVRVRIGYTTPTVKDSGGGSTSPWTITDSTQEVPDRTEFDPATSAQLYTQWINPNDGNQIIPFFPEMDFPGQLRTLIFTGLVDETTRDDLRLSAGTVNLDAFWMGVPGVGFWKFSGFFTSYPVGATKYLVRCEVKTFGTKDWSTYQSVVDPHTGKRVGLNPTDVAAVHGAAYAYGSHEANGLIRLCPYPLANFTTLFGIS